jgi:glycine/D-amino acid oxidase-like deaminating enzyme
VKVPVFSPQSAAGRTTSASTPVSVRNASETTRNRSPRSTIERSPSWAASARGRPDTRQQLTVGHGLIYAELLRSYDEQVARLYAESNQSAIERIEQIVDEGEISCDFERADNYVYTESSACIQAIEREAHAARLAGIDAVLTRETDLPFPVLAAMRVEGQAQFHPGKYLNGLADRVQGDGSTIFEQTQAIRVRSGETCVVETSSGEIRAQHVIVATHLPILDRGFFFAKAHPEKSYAIAARVKEAAAPRGMYTSGPSGRPAYFVRPEGAAPGGRPPSDLVRQAYWWRLTSTDTSR